MMQYQNAQVWQHLQQSCRSHTGAYAITAWTVYVSSMKTWLLKTVSVSISQVSVCTQVKETDAIQIYTRLLSGSTSIPRRAATAQIRGNPTHIIHRWPYNVFLSAAGVKHIQKTWTDAERWVRVMSLTASTFHTTTHCSTDIYASQKEVRVSRTDINWDYLIIYDKIISIYICSSINTF